MHCLLFLSFASAAQPVNRSVSIRYPISSPHYPVLLTGSQLPSLRGVPIGAISVARVSNGELEPIPFQIDRKDRKGNFQIPTSAKERDRELRSAMDENDELVFMASDLGDRLEHGQVALSLDSISEIELVDPNGSSRAWVYVLIRPGRRESPYVRDYVRYNRADDTVEASTYRMGFSSELPFLANVLQSRKTNEDEFGPNIIDSMKLSHDGKFLHRFPFRRTDQDYTSRLVAVKDGPVRVIRRTANRVRIILGIGSPTVFVDYLLYPAGFIMDTIVNFPFKIGFFFSDLSTTALLSLKENEALSRFLVYSISAQQGVPVDGKMSEQDHRFNTLYDSSLLLTGKFGQLIADIALERGSPIEVQVHLADDAAKQRLAEDPERYHRGLGFYMTKWEELNTQTHHILFRAYVLDQFSPAEGLVFLRNAPSLLP
ncbi:MAG: hypothetical protein V3S33_04170 [Gammaproteobacteria bacterium]